MEVDDDKKNEDSSEEVVEVRRARSVEGLVKSIKLVWFRDQLVDERDKSAFEFSTRVSSDGDW